MRKIQDKVLRFKKIKNKKITIVTMAEISDDSMPERGGKGYNVCTCFSKGMFAFVK